MYTLVSSIYLILVVLEVKAQLAEIQEHMFVHVRVEIKV
jgi:hypothetical protein